MSMTQAEYNAKVQELQAMWGDASKLRTHHDKDGALTSVSFEVYWDSHWHRIGWQDRPFKPDTAYYWNETVELRLRGEFARELMHS